MSFVCWSVEVGNKAIALMSAMALLLAGCSPASEDLTSDPVETQDNSVAPEETAIETAAPLASFELSSLGEDPEFCKLVEDSRMRYPGMENPDFLRLEVAITAMQQPSLLRQQPSLLRGN
jgi:putative hemolysin